MSRRSWRAVTGRRVLGAAVTAVFALPPGALGAASVTELLESHQVRPLDPPQAAVDLELPDLQGGRRALSSARGQWVILTFFASWCGPCRSEMPSLQKLHEARAADGLLVLGVSVDRGLGDATRFAEALGLTFPLLWDERGEAARLYKASSIPVSFVIDPNGAVVGISQGSRDWARLTSLVDALLSRDPAPDTVVAGYAPARVPVGLPDDVVPPSATIRLRDPVPRVGEPFSLEVAVKWSGRFEEYLLHPPLIHLPEAVEQLEVSARAGTEEGRRVVLYTVRLAAREAGTFALDPVEIRYTPRGSQEPLSSRIEGVSVEVDPGGSALGLVLGLSAGGALVAGAALWRARRRRQRRGSEPREDPYATLRSRYEEARRRRMTGDVAGFLAEIEAIGRDMGCADGDETLSAALERARYGGQMPPAEVLDRLQRQVERELLEQRPEPDQEARAALMLAGQRTEKKKESRA